MWNWIEWAKRWIEIIVSDSRTIQGWGTSCTRGNWMLYSWSNVLDKKLVIVTEIVSSERRCRESRRCYQSLKYKVAIHERDAALQDSIRPWKIFSYDHLPSLQKGHFPSYRAVSVNDMKSFYIFDKFETIVRTHKNDHLHYINGQSQHQRFVR